MEKKTQRRNKKRRYVVVRDRGTKRSSRKLIAFSESIPIRGVLSKCTRCVERKLLFIFSRPFFRAHSGDTAFLVFSFFLFLHLLYFYSEMRTSNKRFAVEIKEERQSMWPYSLSLSFSPSLSASFKGIFLSYVDGINTFWKNALYIFTSATHIICIHTFIYSTIRLIQLTTKNPCKYENILLTSVFNLIAASGIVPSFISLNRSVEKILWYFVSFLFVIILIYRQ